MGKIKRAITQGRISFIIAHRLSTIRDSDLILLIRDGRHHAAIEIFRDKERTYMIRQADIQDIPRIAEIIIFGKRVAYRTIFKNDHGSFHELQVVSLYEEYKNNPERLEGMFLYDDGIVKGVIRAHPIADKTIEITDFYVEPFFVGQGIGTLLIRHLIRQVREKGGQKIVLWVIKDNLKARKFYEANGFIDSGKTCIIEGTTKEDCCYEYLLTETV